MSGTGFDPSFSLVGLDGRSAGHFIHVPLGDGPIRVPLGDGPLPATAVSDGRGYVLMETITSGLFDAGPTWDHPVNGDVIATGSARWLVVRCGADYLWGPGASYQHCHNDVIDPATGTLRQLPGAPVPGVNGLYYQDWPPLGTVSPDGSTAAVPVSDNNGHVTLHLIDLRSGADRAVAVQLAASPSNECMAWSPDGTWLFAAASGGRLLAVNARSRHVQGLGVTLPQVTQVAVRDAAG
jgi:WD40 repeat protein